MNKKLHWLQRRCWERTPGGPPLPPSPLPLPYRARKGEGAASPSPWPPFSSSMGGGRERTPEIAHAMVACWERGPLARILMEQGGTGCSAGAGSARLAALTFPPAPFRSPTGRGRGRALPPLPPASFRSSIGGGRERTPEIAHAMVACWERGPLARILMDGTGGTGCSVGTAAHAWRPSPSPQPPSAPLRSEEGGGCCLPFPQPPSAPP